MNWRENIQEGSFRGVPFRSQNRDLSGGRRGPTHEFPQRDTPWFEDLGRRTELNNFTCFVGGDGKDYMPARDAMLKALRAKGPGVLIDPWLGQFDVVAISWSLTESTAEGGIATFSIEFGEAGKVLAGEVSDDTAAIAASTAEATAATAAADAAATIDVDGLPDYAENGLSSLVSTFGGDATDAAKLLRATGPVLNAYQAGLQQLDSAFAIVRTPLILAQTVRGIVSAIGGMAAVPLLRLRAIRSMTLAAVDYRGVIGFTPVRVRERANRDAFSNLVVAVGAAEAVKVVASMRFASYPEAQGIRDMLATELDDIAIVAADAGYDDHAGRIDRLRRVMVRDVTVRGANLARVRELVPGATEPSLVIAQRIYGGGSVSGERRFTSALLATREADLVARNRVRHPGFVPGGVALEILSEVANG